MTKAEKFEKSANRDFLSLDAEISDGEEEKEEDTTEVASFSTIFQKIDGGRECHCVPKRRDLCAKSV